MTKDELKKIKALSDDLAVLGLHILRQENIVADFEENRKRFVDTVMMSSTDEACRPVESRVVSESTDPGEPKAKQILSKLRAEYAEKAQEHSELLMEVELWIQTVPDWRLQRLFRLKYLENHSAKEIAELLGFEEGSIRNMESLFWKNK